MDLAEYADDLMEQFRPVHVVQEDADLALALRKGDEAAVRTMYERFGGLVFTVANRMLQDWQRAEEVTQHVFLQAWRNAEQLEPGRDFPCFSDRMAVCNAMREYLKIHEEDTHA